MMRVIALVFLVLAVAPGIFAETVEERRARLEAELAVIEQDITAKRGDLTSLQRERTTLERDISILDTKIETAQLSIRQRDLTITKIRDDISQKAVAIGDVDERVAKSEESLAQLIRRTREIDDISLAELTLGEGSITRLLEEIDNFSQVHEALDASFREMAALRDDLSERKDALEDRQGEEQQLRQIQVLEKQKIEKDEAEKKSILKVTKGHENAYQKLIAEREKTATQIRAELFSLRDSAAIPFGKALEYAKEAEARTGVRAAVILGTLAYETNLGENLGSGVYSADMHPTRDVPVYLEMMAELGLNPESMPVSARPCSKAERDRVGPGKPCGYGWGGAMGPAQFIPSTWVQYKERIGRATGQTPPNPWDPRTAIFAAAILLMDNGADKGTAAAERLAALRYFAGWANASKPSYAIYGDSVMELATKFQSQIDILGG